MSIYNSEIGDELINPRNYNKDIALYLKEEKALMTRILNKAETVIEAGCMHGHNCLFLNSLDINYIGIDIVDRYINMAKNKFKDTPKVMFVYDDITNLKNILFELKITPTDKLIVLFPFNSFGNLETSESTLIKLLEGGFNIAIFTYKIDNFTNSIRSDYYKKSGFKDLQLKINRTGACFFSANGLNSYAFTIDWINEIAQKTNKHFTATTFSRIGVMYKNF